MQSGRYASTTALGVTELLEHILQFLSTSDLVRAQQVNRDFQNTIIHSNRLQEALFVRPKEVQITQSALPTLNPLFAHHAAVGYRTMGFMNNGICYYMGPPYQIFEINPDFLIEDKRHGEWQLGIDIQDVDPTKFTTGISLPTSAHGSWKSMYISNPPCDMHVKVYKTNKRGYSGLHGEGPLKLRSDYKGMFRINGGTFGQLLEQAVVMRNSEDSEYT